MPPRGPEHYYQREGFSVRVGLGIIFLIATLYAGYVAWQGPVAVFGFPTESGTPSVDGATLLSSGEAVAARTDPSVLGPGYLFYITLEIPAGLDGAAKFTGCALHTDNPYWPSLRIDQVLLDEWDPPSRRAKMETREQTYVNLQVPERQELIGETVELRFTVYGERPIYVNEGVSFERYEETLIVPCRLGRGRILTTSPLQPSRYNRYLWVALFFVGAYFTAQLPIKLRKPKRKHLPQDMGNRRR